MNKSTCDVCAPLKQGWLADEGTIPAGVRHAQDSTVRLASWAADARAFRICSHCGTAWDLQLPREGYWEAIDLPAAVRSLLGEGSPRRASRLFTGADLQARWNARLSPQARGAHSLASVPQGVAPPGEAAAAKLQGELLVLQDQAPGRVGIAHPTR